MSDENKIKDNLIMNRLFTISDIHTNHKQNMKWIEDLKSGGENSNGNLKSIYDARPFDDQGSRSSNQIDNEKDDGNRYCNDVLIIAGDISDNTQQCITTLQKLSDVFGLVFFVPGNHDLWIHHNDTDNNRIGTVNTFGTSQATAVQHPTRPLSDSIDKLRYLLEVCDSINIQTKPKIVSFRGCPNDCPNVDTHKISKLLIVPILSWHHVSFDTEPDVLAQDQISLDLCNIKLPYLEQLMMDYSHTRWPNSVIVNYHHSCLTQKFPIGTSTIGTLSSCTCSDMKHHGHQGLKSPSTIHESEAVAFYMDQLNDQLCKHFNWEAENQAAVDFVVSFSHFAPDIRLVPEKRRLLCPILMKAAGSIFLKRRLKRLSPDVHVFGHLHFGWDMIIDQTRYIQAPLGYPSERAVRLPSMAIGNCPNEPLLIFKDGEFVTSFTAKMSDMYRYTARTPDDTLIESYVEEVWKRYLT